jgi:hypothetical protein
MFYIVLFLLDTMDRVEAHGSSCTCGASHSRYNWSMKPLPAPEVPGKTEFERFDNAVRQVLTVSKVELLKREEEAKQKLATTKHPKK